jgi:hypothetical protein
MCVQSRPSEVVRLPRSITPRSVARITSTGSSCRKPVSGRPGSSAMPQALRTGRFAGALQRRAIGQHVKRQRDLRGERRCGGVAEAVRRLRREGQAQGAAPGRLHRGDARQVPAGPRSANPMKPPVSSRTKRGAGDAARAS